MLFCMVVAGSSYAQGIAGIDCAVLKPMLTDTVVTNWLSYGKEKKRVVLFDRDHLFADCSAVRVSDMTYEVSRNEDVYKNYGGNAQLLVYARKRRHPKNAFDLFIDNHGLYVKATFRKTANGYVFDKAALGFVDGPVDDASHKR